MKLQPHIIFRCYGDYTVVYDVKKGAKSIFEGIAFDILELLKKEITFEEIVDRLMISYSMADDERAVIEDDVFDFLSQLSQLEMIDSFSSDSEVTDSDSDKQLTKICEELNQLEHVYFELTYNCNQKCIHCYEEHGCPLNKLDFEEICTILDELKTMGVLEVTFTGGEVATRKDFISICAYASILGFAIHVYTNGIGFSDEDILKLSQMNIADISFSVYSLDPSIHDAITKVSGSLQKTLRTMFALRSNGISVIIKTVVLKQNNESFKSLIDFSKIMNIPIETSMQILPTSPDDSRPSRYRLNDENLYFENMLYEAETLGYGIHNVYCDEKRTRVCGLGRCINVTPNGDVYPCNVLNVTVGNLRKQSISEVWNSPQLIELRKFSVSNLSEKCRKCENLNYCLYCPGAVLRETGSMTTPAPDTCSISRAKRRVFELKTTRKENCNEKI